MTILFPNIAYIKVKYKNCVPSIFLYNSDNKKHVKIKACASESFLV